MPQSTSLSHSKKREAHPFSCSHNMSEDIFNEDDDDFGDFGGFEAADPVEPREAQPLPQGIQASPSPWALLPGSTTAGQPDIQRTETRVAQKSSEAELAATNSTNQHKQESQPFVANFDDQEDNSFQGFQAYSKTEGIQKPAKDANTPSVPSQTGPPNKLVGAFDDELADTDDEKKENKREEKTVAESIGEVSPSKTAAVSIDSLSSPDRSKSVSDGTSKEQTKANDEAAKHLTRLQEKLKMTEQDRTRLQKELEEVQGLQKQLKGELAQLHEQTARYEQLQAKHVVQLDEMRKAGHDALVLIVEEYKELCKTAVLQQQEASQRDLQEYLKQQSLQEEKRQKQREEDLSKILEREREKFEAQLQEKLTEVEERHKLELKDAILTESKRAEELLKNTIEAEKEKSASAIEQAIKEEKKKNQKIFQEQKEEFLKFLSEEREDSKKELEKNMTEEINKMKESVEVAVDRERQKSEEIQKQTRNQVKSEMEDYIKMHKQEDLLVRKRQLTSMDLFLESAREQLKLLMSDAEANTDSTK